MNFLYTAHNGDLEVDPQQLNLSLAEKNLLEQLLEGLRRNHLSRLDLTLGNGQVILLVDINET